MTFSDSAYLTSAKVRARYGVSDMSLYRWEKDPESRFPKPVRINGRRFWSLEALLEYERSLVAPSHPVEAA